MSSHSLPKVSVLMPVYNTEDYVAESIASVQNQTFLDWELVVVDDASTDQTADIVKAISLQDPRVKYYRLDKNLKVPSAVRKQALIRSEGHYIAYLDADDLYEPHTLLDLSQYLDAHQECFCVYGDIREVDVKSRVIDNPEECYWHSIPEAFKALPVEELHQWDNIIFSKFPIMYQTSMIRREMLEIIQPIQEQIIWDDYYYFIKLFRYNKAGVHRINKIMCQYRYNREGISKCTNRFGFLLANVGIVVNAMMEDVRVDEIDPKYTASRLSCKYYQDICWVRFRFNQNDQAIQCALYALFQDKNVKLSDWVNYCLPFLLRAILPISLYRLIRTAKHLVFPPVSKPAYS